MNDDEIDDLVADLEAVGLYPLVIKNKKDGEKLKKCCFCDLAGSACVGCPDHPDYWPEEDK